MGLNSDEEQTQIITQEGSHLCFVEEYPHDTNAARLVLCWNALEGFDGPTVTRLAAWLERYNGDELRQMLTEDNA